jgi:hypothetical protein
MYARMVGEDEKKGKRAARWLGDSPGAKEGQAYYYRHHRRSCVVVMDESNAVGFPLRPCLASMMDFLRGEPELILVTFEGDAYACRSACVMQKA